MRAALWIIGLILYTLPSWAGELSVTQHDNLIRFILKVDQNTSLQVVPTPGGVRLKANSKLSLAPEAWVQQSLGAIAGAKLAQDKLTFDLQLSAAHHEDVIRPFVGAEFVGFDLVDKEHAQNILAPASVAKQAPEARKAMLTAVPSAENIIPKNNRPVTQVAPEPKKSNVSKDMAANSGNRKGDIIALTFPWANRPGTATFARGNNLFIVFDQDQPIDLQVIRAQLPDDWEVKQLDSKGDNYTCIVISAHRPIHHQTSYQPDGWTITLGKDVDYMTLQRSAIQIIDNNKDANILLSVAPPTKHLTITDPWIGDKLDVFPVAEPNYLFAVLVEYIGLNFLPTGQGIVIKQLMPGIKTQTTTQGLEVTLPSRLLGPDFNKATAVGVVPPISTLLPTQSFFAFTSFFPTRGARFLHGIEYHMKNITQSPVDVRSASRLDLAQFYMNHGFMAEGLGVLNSIQNLDPTYIDSPTLNMMRVAALFYLNRFEDAYAIVNKIPAAGLGQFRSEELELWKNVCTLGVNPRADLNLNFLYALQSVMKDYPAELKLRIGFMDITSRIFNGDYKVAKEVLFGLQSAAFSEHWQNTDMYFRGVLSAKEGDNENAESLLIPLSKNIKDNMNRTRATQALVELLLKEKKIGLKEAIERLERVSVAWRGDSVELDLLNYLGSLYLQNNQPVDALVRWREAVNQNQSGSLVLASQMSKVFTDLFLHDQPVALNAFDKVSLYFEFQELTPIGKMGDQIIEDLVDSLLQLDLLPRAEQLLSHLISNRVEGAERDRMITKLADVYLQDNKASDMLALLEQPPQAELSAEVLEHRRNLKIEGFLKMRQTEQALALIGEREDWDSRIKRVEVYWSLSDWGQVIDLIEPMQEVWADADVPLDKTQAALLAQLAAAHSMQNHNAEVSFLFKTFSPLLTDQPLVKKAMNFLAHNNRKINSNALAKTVGVSTMEDFMKNFANIMADIAIQKAY